MAIFFSPNTCTCICADNNVHTCTCTMYTLDITDIEGISILPVQLTTVFISCSKDIFGLKVLFPSEPLANL